jgi:hypothetical protein
MRVYGLALKRGKMPRDGGVKVTLKRLVVVIGTADATLGCKSPKDERMWVCATASCVSNGSGAIILTFARIVWYK